MASQIDILSAVRHVFRKTGDQVASALVVWDDANARRARAESLDEHARLGGGLALGVQQQFGSLDEAAAHWSRAEEYRRSALFATQESHRARSEAQSAAHAADQFSTESRSRSSESTRLRQEALAAIANANSH